MKTSLKVAAPVATIVAAAAIMALTTDKTSAGEYCRQDVTGHMTSCSFDSMEECKATSAGIGGDCFRDPFLNDSRNAFAYQPNAPHSKKHARPRRGEASRNF